MTSQIKDKVLEAFLLLFWLSIAFFEVALSVL